MRAFLSFLISLTFLSPLNAQDKHPDFTKAWRSVIGIHVGSDFCTAFPISVNHYITASHCTAELNSNNMETLSGSHARLVKHDDKHDLAMIEIDEIHPVLELGAEPKVGDTLYMLGLGEAAARRMNLDGPFPYIVPAFVVSLHEHPFQNDDHSMTFFGAPISGMSGGPVINSEGKVVSVTQGAGRIGSSMGPYGVGAEYNVFKNFIK